MPLSYQHSPLGRWTQGHGTPDSPGIGAGRGTPDGNRGRGSPSPSRICQPVPGKSGTETGESPRFRTNRESVAWSGRPACPTAIPIARAGTRVASLYWEVKDGCGQLCWATRVGTPSPAARPCRRHRPTDSLWVRPAGIMMSDGHPDSPIVHRTISDFKMDSDVHSHGCVRPIKNLGPAGGP